LPKKPEFKRPDFRTFVTEQRTLLFMQIAVLLGLLIECFMFIALLYYGRPPADEFAQIHQFFLVAAVWVLTIDAGVVLFWWVTKQGRLRAGREPTEAPANE
jgi:hypothetical protein